MLAEASFTQTLGAETARFETELLAEPGAPELPLFHTHIYLSKTQREFWLFQARDAQGRPEMQAAVYVSRSRISRYFAQGSVPRMGMARSSSGERDGILTLRRLCAENTDLMTLRLQPTRIQAEDLQAFERHGRAAGFEVTAPIDVTRTLLLDLQQTPEEFLAGLRSKTRSAFRHRSRGKVILRSIADPAFVEPCQRAEEAAFGRTGGKSGGFDFATHFRMAREHPDRAFAVGLFLATRPETILAFSTAVRHGKLVEYTAAGSFSDPELRSIPFSYFLIWELILWSREHGAQLLDLGGVSPGGEDDPLAGITRFKRYLCDREAEVGREMISVLRPARYAAFRSIHGLLSSVKR
jgi:hypothetical protein